MVYRYVKELRDDEVFGTRLPVDINPLKICSFNCVYCPFGNTTRQIVEREEFFPPEDVYREINDFIKRNGEPDYVWLKGSGDPALYLGLKNLTQLLKQNYPNLKIGSWLNGSLLHQESVRRDFSYCDFIVVHLDSLNPKSFLQISRHHSEVKLNNIIEGIKLFKDSFKGRFGISSIFINNINANEESIEALKDFLLEINPDLYIVQEFNNKNFKPVSEEFKAKLIETFSDLPFTVIFRL